MLKAPTTPRKHLLLPSHPTPNGRLHLGHIAGPYLKVDVLKRALRRKGEHAVVMVAVDSFESYVLLRAHQLGIEPGQVVERYAREIQEDLAALDIEVELFIDPLASTHSELYRESITESIEVLKHNSAIEARKESFLYCPASSRFIVGCWLLGNCPHCGSDSGGYSCEVCGLHYRPEELANKRARLEEGELKTVTCRTLFLRVHNTALLRQRIESMLPPTFQKILMQYLERSQATLRVSVPGTWGVPIDVEGEVQPQVVYSGFASLGLLYAYGQEYARLFGTANPFSPDSDVTITCSFGIDNTVTRALSCIGGALSKEKFRPPDSLLLNYFYQLEGSKFSTSRNHAIWASDIGNISPTISDIVRFHLLETSPEEAETDFRVADFLATAKELYEKWNPVIERALLSATPSPAPELFIQALEDALSTQEKLLDTSSFSSRAVPEALRHWITLSHDLKPESQYWWLKGFALLAWPVLPRLCSAVWSHMGHTGFPEENSFFQLPPIKDDSVQLFQSISMSDLQSCLPVSHS